MAEHRFESGPCRGMPLAYEKLQEASAVGMRMRTRMRFTRVPTFACA